MEQSKHNEWWEFYRRLDSAAFEPFFEQYKEHLKALNERVAATGEPLEGNLFYFHHSEYLGLPPHPDRRKKRKLLAAYTMTGTRIMEVGFNAGHSALLGLMANPNLHYVGVDIAEHAYVEPCFQYLRSQFGSRVELHKGDSTEVLRQLVKRREKFDLYHIDGGHSSERAYLDLREAVALGSPGQVLLMDDTNAKSVRSACNLLTLEGAIAPIPVLLELVSEEQTFFEIKKLPGSAKRKWRWPGK